jgi:hypothetical protein
VAIRETIHSADGGEGGVDYTGDFGYQRTIAPLMYLTAADLVPGDAVYSSNVYDDKAKRWVDVDLKLNDTVVKNYGEARETNQLIWSGIESESNDWEPEQPMWINFTAQWHWDKLSGFLVKMKIEKRYSKYADSVSIFGLEVIDTNLWRMSKGGVLPSWAEVVIPTSGVVGCIAFLGLRRRRKSRGDTH